MNSEPYVLLVDAHSERRAERARQIAACLAGVRISECADPSDALLKLAATRHALIVLDIASCGESTRMASQYWRLTAPDMEQILVHVDTASMARHGENSAFGVTHCVWSDMPGPLLTWARRYRKMAA
jgi:hypothetical protein